MKMKFRQLRNELHSSRSGSAGMVVLVVVVALALLGYGGYWLYSNTQIGTAEFKPITAFVTEGDFIAQVLDQGEIQSSANVEVRCAARARNGELRVIEVVAEGTRVKGGDFLVRLDQTIFETEREQQKIQLANAKTAQIQSDAAHKAAVASLDEYKEGIYKEAYKTIENEIFDADAGILMARQELDQSKAVLEHSIKLHEKGFIPTQTRDADAFAVERAKKNLEKADNSKGLAELKLDVLERITQNKELILLDSEIAAAQVKRDNDLEALRIEEQKLADINQQITNCVITVPPNVEGQVVYAKESSRSGTEWMLEEGTTVRENQVLLRLPDPNKMEVKALINEQSITLIGVGMPASIRVDALNNQTLKGVVTRVSQYAEQNGWMSASNIRKYAVSVKIDAPPEVLKPGMNASVSIQTRYEKGVLNMPIQCVYGVQEKYFCLARSPGEGWETREVETGGDNSQVVVIRSGLKVGDEVVMNPGAYKDLMDLPEVAGDEPLEVPEGMRVEPSGPPLDQESGKGPPQGGGEAGSPRNGGANGGMDIAGMINQQVSQADTNGDGKLDTAEIESLEERSRGMMQRADTNGDGEITRAEIDTSIKTMEQQMRQRGGGAGGGGRGQGDGQGGGQGGDGQGGGGGHGAGGGSGGGGPRGGGQ